MTICACCESFTFDGGKPAEGIGRCLVQWEPSINPLRRWDERSCVLFGKAPDMAKRLQFIEMRRREEGGNAAAA